MEPSGFHAYNCPRSRIENDPCVGCDEYPIFRCRIMEPAAECEVLMVAVPDGDGQYRMPPLPFSFTLLSCELAYMRPGENCGYTIDWPIARVQREHPRTPFPLLSEHERMNHHHDLSEFKSAVRERAPEMVENYNRLLLVRIRAEVEAMDWPDTIGG